MNEWELHISNFPGHQFSGNLIFESRVLGSIFLLYGQNGRLTA